MRFFPRGAFNQVLDSTRQPPDHLPLYAQAPIPQWQQSVLKQQHWMEPVPITGVPPFDIRGMDGMRLLMQRISAEMPMTGPQAMPQMMVLMMPQMMPQAALQTMPQSPAMQLDLRADPLHMDPLLIGPAWTQMAASCDRAIFGRPVF